jgi:hypothetical protein
VGELVVRLQRLPRETELPAMEPGCEEYCEREIDEVEWQGGRVYLHLGARGTPRRTADRLRRAGPVPHRAVVLWRNSTFRLRSDGRGDACLAIRFYVGRFRLTSATFMRPAAGS